MTPFRWCLLLASTCPLVGGDAAEVHRRCSAVPAACSRPYRSLNQRPISQKFLKFSETKPAMNGRQFIYHMQGSDQDLPGQPQSPRKHQPLVLPGRQDRRAGRQRLGQIDAAADHGRHRQGLRRRGLGRRRRPRRLPGAGAAARCRAERSRKRDEGRRRQEGAARPLQRDRRQLLGRDRRGDGQAAGRDRQPRTCGNSTPRSIWRWTRCAARRTTPT